MIGFDRNNSDAIGFVYEALSCRAITRSDVKAWAIKMLLDNDVDELPMCIIDLMDFDENSQDLFKIIGFVPHWRGNKKQKIALYGVAVKKGRVLTDLGISSEEALSMLEKHPEIEKRFRETFPFINY
ncbi:hypothetical protein [Klebsiella aerogenes]|uniref:hypothetical protein n=1 Tax=Klebsiella aerogenes TaxID=548 RepID=UPI0039840B56